jgi:hypothetical protein
MPRLGIAAIIVHRIDLGEGNAVSVRRFVVIALVSGLVGAGFVAVSAEASPAASCTWTSERLPTGHSVTEARIEAAGPNGYLVGALTPQNGTKARPLVWHNKVPTVLPDLPDWGIWPQAVNGRGDVAGFLTPVSSPTGTWRAFLYRGGTYVILPSPAGVDTWATEVNGSGDVVGHISTGTSSNPQLVLWPADAPQTYRVITTGFVVGLDDTRRIITGDGRIISPNGSVTRISGQPDHRVEMYAGGRLVGGFTDFGNRREWGITGDFIREIPGHKVVGVSPSGLVATWFRLPMGSAIRLTDNGQFAGWAPATSISGVTDRNELYGTPNVTPTLWTCG